MVIGKERVELSSAIAKPHIIAIIIDKPYRWNVSIKAQNPHHPDKFII
jgi:hypothetical protein